MLRQHQGGNEVKKSLRNTLLGSEIIIISWAHPEVFMERKIQNDTAY